MRLRIRGLEVITFALDAKPNLNADLAEGVGAAYASAGDTELASIARDLGNVDIIVEATGHSPLMFEAMERLGKNGVLVLTGIAGGGRRGNDVHADHILQGFVLGNKVVVGSVNAARVDFEQGVADLVLAQAWWPGWPTRLLTHRPHGPVLTACEPCGSGAGEWSSNKGRVLAICLANTAGSEVGSSQRPRSQT